MTAADHDKLRRWVCALMSVSLFTIWAVQQASGESGQARKHLIYYGWGMPDSQYVRDAWRSMEKLPFDGSGIVIAIDRDAWKRGDRSTGNQIGWNLMGSRGFRFDDFAEAVDDLQRPRWQESFHMFLPVALSASGSASTLTWFDDTRWRTVANNFGVIAQIVAKSGLKGFVLDPEGYGYDLFSYRFQRTRQERSFDDYKTIARQRGRELMRAVATHSPNVVLISLYGYTLPLSELRREGTLQDTAYGLLPAFYDGLLEEMPEGGTLVDGYEFAYGFKEERQFQKGRRRIRTEAVSLSAVPERYRQHVKVGFGLWADHGGKRLSPVEVQRSARMALDVTDSYVWIYSQRIGFYPPSADARPYLDAITAARGRRAGG
jgi:hypothetical protein